MNKETISDKQGIVLVALFTMGSSLFLGSGGYAKKDIWIAVIIALIVATLAVLVYGRILYRFPGKDLFDILEMTFGKLAGKFFSLLYIWYSFHLGALVIRNFGEFINIPALPDTPMIVPIAVFTILCTWIVKEGIEVLGRWGEFFIFVALGLIAFIALLSMPSWGLDNLRPVLKEGLKPAIKGAFNVFTFPFAETVVFTMIFSSLKWKGSVYKVYIFGICIAGLAALYIFTRNVMVLGVKGVSASYFPSYTAVSRINIGDFIQRMEITVAIVFTSAGFVKISICIMATSKGIAKVFSLKDYRHIVTPISILMIILSIFIYQSTMEMIEWAFRIYPYYALPFQVFLPLFFLCVIEIKVIMNKRAAIK